MIFNVPGHIDLIRSGRKTQTRRVNRGIYQVGRDYAVQRKRGVTAEICMRIEIDAIWEERCEYGWGNPYYILPRNAQAEGGYTVEEFEDVFRTAYPMWNGETRWAFRFHVIEVRK